ncbi:MAG: acetylxylan esterase [Planctomycetota bacterium]|nr:acetylxylan esterase [Planctomycetota bacterium]
MCRAKNPWILLLATFVLFPCGGPVGSASGPPEDERPTSTPPPAREKVKIAGVVLKWIRGDKEANYRRIEPLIRKAARDGARIVCTTECFLDGYAIADKSIPLDEYRDLGEVIPSGPYFRRLSSLADELDIYLVAGMLEADGEARYNTAVLLGPDGALVGKYRKQKLGHELVRNRPGTDSPVFRTPYGRVGIMICADRTEPSIVERFCARGADFLICPSGGMFGPKRNDPIVQARSRENRRTIVFVHPAEFLVTAPDGSIRDRTIVGDRLLIPKQDAGGESDGSGVFFCELPLPVENEGETAPAKLDVPAALAKPIIDPGLPRREVQSYLETRIARLPRARSAAEWEVFARKLRRDVLRRVVYRGAAAHWRDTAGRVEWRETLEGGPGYRIRKLCYEAVPGLWVPALLYEPLELEGKVPAVLNVNGHDGEGKAAKYKQIRCINQAKRGMLALNVEWIGMGQLRSTGFGHSRMNQLDLCGTSGLAPFFLSMKRALDILLSLEHTDPERVAVAGLSGGGWQTIFVSSLDTRVRLANPVAGYGSFVTRTTHLADLGDSEQTPVDLAGIADYTHLTALLAPRPALLTFNSKDTCCFKSGHTLPPLMDATRPIYELYGRPEALRSHVNHDPGDHNFGKENREALYRMLTDFFLEDPEANAAEIPSDSELKSSEDLHVELPEDNADFQRLALDLSRHLPRNRGLPGTPAMAREWRLALGRLVRERRYAVAAEVAGSEERAGGRVTYWKLRLGDSWTLPAVEIAPEGARETVVLVADSGRGGVAREAEAVLAAGKRLLAVDPFYLGESRIDERAHLFALLVSSVGDRPLGLQASQLAAVARWLGERHPEQPVTVSAVGRRASLMALVAGALEEQAIAALELRDALGSLRQVIEENLGVNEAPELFCFGLLEEFDMLQLSGLILPRPLRFVDPSERLEKELQALRSAYANLGKDLDPLR